MALVFPLTSINQFVESLSGPGARVVVRSVLVEKGRRKRRRRIKGKRRRRIKRKE